MAIANIPPQILDKAINHLRGGDVIAYPTEAVYGLGCDPFNLNAVTRILQIKNRSVAKGFILIAADFEQVEDLVELLPPPLMARVTGTWPGPITWLFPASRQIPEWVRGHHDKVAVRVTAHPIARQLCEAFGKPLVSTSANIEGEPPLRDTRSVSIAFHQQVDFIVPGLCGPQLQPTEIRDAVTGEVIRNG